MALSPSIPPQLASQAQRPKTAPFFLLPSVLMTGMAYASGGIPELSDMGFLWMTIGCAGFLIGELRHFKTRQGWGAATFYLGVLVWFCHDYMTHWFWCNWAEWPVEYMPTVGKMAFLYCLFVTLMAFGMTLPVRDGAVRPIARYPEPNSPELLFWFAIITFGINIGYEACFSQADLLTTMQSRYFGGRSGQVETTLGGLGAINTSFTAYLVMLVGSVHLGAIAGMAYALFTNPPSWKRLLMFLIWGHVFMLAFGGGTRTAILGVLAPLVAFLLIKALRNPAFLKMAMPVILTVAAVSFVLLQIQTHHRMGEEGLDIKQGLQSEKTFAKIEGNTMFSEALDDYTRFPEQKKFFYDNAFPGEGALRAFPEMAFWFIISPVPRPLMTLMGLKKPIDPAWSWRSRAGDQSGETDVISGGTTCSYGLVGSWYFRFGPIGMMEGALLMGWAYAWVERLIRSATVGHLRLMALLIGLSSLSLLFFFFRDLVFFSMWPLILIFAGLAFFIKTQMRHH